MGGVSGGYSDVVTWPGRLNCRGNPCGGTLCVIRVCYDRCGSVGRLLWVWRGCYDSWRVLVLL